MLKIQDENQISIKNWDKINSDINVLFKVHNTYILTHYENESSITVFYGLLDQEYSEKNTAQFVNSIIRNGPETLSQLYGSFILVHYDFSQRNFLIANDAMGDFAVHYIRKDDKLILSDLPKALVSKDYCCTNQDRLLHYFALSQPASNGSFFQHINQLNAGQYIKTSKTKIQHQDYYKPPNHVDFKSKSVSDLSLKFNQLMQQVIQYQSQNEHRIGVMMSGGLDSTFVVANSIKAGKQVNTFSYVFPNMPDANESIWIDAMRTMNIDSMHTFSGEEHWPLKSPWHISLNTPYSNPYRLMKSVIYHQAQHKNIKVLLSGVFADHLYTGYIYWLVDRIKRNPFKAIASLYKTTRSEGFNIALRQISPKKWSKKIKTKAPWLTSKAKKLLINQESLTYQHPHTQQFALTHGIATAQSVWIDNEYAFKHNIFVRHPFRDRRIIEFLQSLPAWVLGDYAIKKNLPRIAAKELLPDSIIRRQKVTTLKPMFKKGVLEKELIKVRNLLNSSQCQWQEFIKAEIINSLLKNPNGQFSDADYMVLWQCISFELWKKRLSRFSQ